MSKTATEKPGEKWIAMWKTWTLRCEWSRKASYTDPDNFRMYIYNDFHGYGIQELIENVLIEFDKVAAKKEKDEESIKQMWVIVAALIHWLGRAPLYGWMGLDDGQRWSTTVGLIGTAFLETLNELDRTSNLTPATSVIKDLSLVISLYLLWGEELDDADEDAEWRKDILMYLKKGGIDVVKNGCCGMKTTMESYRKKYGDVKVSKAKAKFNRWGWRKAFKDFKDQYDCGGERFNILKMSRKERAEHAFDGKDPLAQISDKDLEEGNLMIG